MAKSKRIDEERFASKRRFLIANNLLPRKVFLIVCEGAKTEPNYFKAFNKLLPKGILHLEIHGEGKNTLSLVDTAIEIRDKAKYDCKKGLRHRPYDSTWVVFDRDSFPPQNFNEAIQKANRNKINVAYSNEAFELWYLLHFQYHNTAIIRKRYKGLLTHHLGQKYEKNSEDMYDLLNEKGDQQFAIKNAIKLYGKYDHSKPALENPSTTVHYLVRKLNQYLNLK